MQLSEFLHSKGFEYTPAFTGDIERFDRNGKTLAGWFVGDATEAKFGDWATGEEYSFEDSTYIQSLTPEALEELRLAQAARKEKREKEKLERQVKAAEKAEYLWNNSKPCETHPYLTKKRVKSYGLKSSIDLIVPIYNQGKLVSLQFIDDNGSKRFLPGGKLSGSYFRIGNPAAETTNNTFYLCEGYATGASIFEATGSPVVVAFNAGNLPKVAEYLKTKSIKEVIVCADNDQCTPGNPGLTQAQKAADILGSYIFYPDFTKQEAEIEKLTDWNDWINKYGAGGFVQEKPKTSTTEVKPQKEKKAKAKKDDYCEKKHALMLLNHLGDKVLRIEDNIFLYDGAKWNELTEVEIDNYFRNSLNEYMGGILDSKKVNSAYRTFYRMLPYKTEKEINLFLPSKACANFLDGTLHLKRDLKTNTYTTEFLPHNKKDYLNSVTPIEFKKIDKTQTNELLDKLLNEIFEGDEHKEEKIGLLQEMAGAMLVPNFDQMFFLTGVSGSRKSTLIKLLLKMVRGPNGEHTNVSFVDPASMEGFEIEGMVNKLINVNTDIDDQVPIKRSFIKRFSDQMPYQVNRKHKSVVKTMLPVLHVYACNDLPPMHEKSEAMKRRVSVVRFKNDLTNGEGATKEIKFYEDVIWAHNPMGIFAFALKGLERLLTNGGTFTQINSSTKEIQKWKNENNLCALFLEAVEHREIEGIYLQRDAKIERTKLGKAFLDFVGGSALNSKKNSFLGGFYQDLERKKYVFSKVEGVRFVGGFSYVPGAGGQDGRGF